MALASFPDVLRRFLFALPLISCLGPLQGATLERLTLDDMIQKSTAIVRGQVTSSWAAYSGTSIFTHYRILVNQQWKGAAQGSAEFVIPGGKLGSVQQIASGVPQISTSKEYIFFLWTSRGGLTYIIGFSQGLIEVPPGGGLDGLAVRAASSEPMLMPGTGQAMQDQGISMSVRDLTSRISSSLATAKQ